ncbi:MAG: nitrate reductase subunit beta [Bacteroidales bacterium]
MKIKSQICMVLSLDKCIGCHTCSVTCKNVWTTRQGVEYTWFNNVETKPGLGYPTNWENQKHYRGGWEKSGKGIKLKQGSRIKELASIFGNPYMPSVDDYYEPFTFDYSTLQSTRKFKTPPTARPYSILTGRRMEKIEKGPNWEDNLGGTFKQRSGDVNLEGIDTKDFEAFERSFMYYLPRLCEHCLNPACVAACPSGAIYKRDEDGIVLIDEERCRGWRECVSACPYKKSYFNWVRKRSEKCTFCFPRIENGKPTVCSESCVGRIRYIGVMLYDEDRVKEYASTDDPEKLYEAQLNIFLDPHDETVCAEAMKQGIPHTFIEGAKNSPVYKMMKEWKIAFPLHPEFRTLPMVWYIPPLSPVMSGLEEDTLGKLLTGVDEMRIPLKYMANMLCAGNEKPVKDALVKLVTMRNRMRKQLVDQADIDPAEYTAAGLTALQFDEMYRYLALAPYEERFVIPTMRTDHLKDTFAVRSESGFDKPRGKERAKNLMGGM